MAKRRIDPRLQALLDEFPGFTTEQGAKHVVIRDPAGRQVGVWPNAGATEAYGETRRHLNLRAAMRRHQVRSGAGA